MEDEIVNKVAQSKLITFNLEDYYPKGERMVLDIKDWLYEGFILKEKEFRAFVDAHDWSQYKDAYVAMHCSTDAIIPGWAYLLLSVKLSGIAKKAVQGSLVDLETSIYQSVIENIDISEYQDRLIIIKGCSKKPVPANAYLFLAERLKPVAKSIMYGEACSSVPLYKRK
ncbi:MULTISPECIES: DUF2480 family protein [Maribacter]|uniref:DUF2480 family protein n=1 Tax=Maribacter dokdonensis TaxID=320912 RepID=A0ABY0UWI3_9FLAO|nr:MULTISPECIES: DUF2480 family protein [Maribacter]APA64418.1 hypothetical protein YQ22_08855 [Maribacter sp. 1_2014MBL_MicDiv]KSA12705.1 hypothetical protein I600_2138 [Maribacter dokdonensis DSW-8]MBU2900457.1 DUF2480 family protein [Maribacter dokdonensis]SDT28986.1 Protein of unknown function [Maribacter dokdonensis]|tara:strand:+ start:916 stop:1422 length:507 start_codon:yes stop_codon:yes gene_type:complete